MHEMNFISPGVCKIENASYDSEEMRMQYFLPRSLALQKRRDVVWHFVDAASLYLRGGLGISS